MGNILLIYGAGGFAKELFDIVMRSYPLRYEKIYFIDDFAEEGQYYFSESIHFTSINNIFGNDTQNLEGIVGVGEPYYRDILTKRFESEGIKLATIIDSTAIVSPSATIGEGCIVCENSTIHADAIIGKGTLIQPCCIIGHDIKIGDYSVISSMCAPGGKSTFGNRVYMGMDSSSKEGLMIGDDVIIAMGSAVFKDIESGITVVGNPARITKGNGNHRVFG